MIYAIDNHNGKVINNNITENKIDKIRENLNLIAKICATKNSKTTIKEKILSDIILDQDKEYKNLEQTMKNNENFQKQSLQQIIANNLKLKQKIQTKDQLLRQKDQQLNNQQLDFNQLLNYNIELNVKIDNQILELNNTKQELENKYNEFNRLNHIFNLYIYDKEMEILNKNNEIQEKNNEILNKNNEIQEKNQFIAFLMNNIHKSKEQIIKQEKEIKQLKNKQLENQIKENNEQLTKKSINKFNIIKTKMSSTQSDRYLNN